MEIVDDEHAGPVAADVEGRGRGAGGEPVGGAEVEVEVLAIGLARELEPAILGREFTAGAEARAAGKVVLGQPRPGGEPVDAARGVARDLDEAALAGFGKARELDPGTAGAGGVDRQVPVAAALERGCLGRERPIEPVGEQCGIGQVEPQRHLARILGKPAGAGGRGAGRADVKAVDLGALRGAFGRDRERAGAGEQPIDLGDADGEIAPGTGDVDVERPAGQRGIARNVEPRGAAEFLPGQGGEAGEVVDRERDGALGDEVELLDHGVEGDVAGDPVVGAAEVEIGESQGLAAGAGKIEATRQVGPERRGGAVGGAGEPRGGHLDMAAEGRELARFGRGERAAALKRGAGELQVGTGEPVEGDVGLPVVAVEFVEGEGKADAVDPGRVAANR